MIKKNSLVLFILSTIFFLSMKEKEADPMKCLVYGNNIGYDVQLKINGVIISEKEVSGLKIFSENHPFKSQADEMPPFLKSKMAFVLKEGENTIELKFQSDPSYNNINDKFSFALNSPNFNVPLYYFSSEKKSGSVTSLFFISTSEESKKHNTSLGNEDASFIFSQRVNYFQPFLNGEGLKSFGNAGGLTDLNLIEGNNTLEIKYKSEYEGEFSYYIQTPHFTKKVNKIISKDQLDKLITDVYELKK